MLYERSINDSCILIEKRFFNSLASMIEPWRAYFSKYNPSNGFQRAQK